MRVLLAQPGPSFSVSDVAEGWVEGLRECGAKVGVFNLADRLTFYGSAMQKRGRRYMPMLDQDSAQRLAVNGLLSHCFQMAPDVLVVVSAFYTPNDLLDLIRARGVKVVVLHTESPYQDDEQADRALHADLNIVNDPTNLSAFPAGTYYQPHSYRPSVHHPDGRSREVDFGFVGTGYPSRVEFLERVDLSGLRVLLGGNWQGLAEGSPLRDHLAHPVGDCMDNTDTADLYRSCRVSANLYRREANRPDLSAGVAMGPREVELAACGAFFLRDPRPESDEVLPMLPSFSSPEELSDLLRWWLADDARREAAAACARAAVKDRTFKHAAARLLRRLDTAKAA